jgi:hypothetical protein
MNAVNVTVMVLIETLVTVIVKVIKEIVLEYAEVTQKKMNVVFVTGQELLHHFVIVKETLEMNVESVTEQVLM